MTSIRGGLLGWLILGFAAASGAAGYGIFHTARAEASELFDYELRTVALSLPAKLETAISAEHPDPGFEGIADDRIVIEIWDRDGNLSYHSQNAPAPTRYPEGIHTVERNDSDWRVFGLQQPDRFIQVAQPFAVREDLALRVALHSLWPLSLMVAATIVLVPLIVGRGLAPVRDLSRALSTRSIDSLEPLRLDGTVPVEIRPLIVALNDLLQRLNTATQAQRTFVADAAHELRSPLAALKLQLQSAAGNGTLNAEDRTLERIEARLNRIIHLVHQLLTLAREDASPATSMKPLSLRRVCEQAVGDFSLIAEAKRIDLGLECEGAFAPNDPYTTLGEQHSLNVLLNNLIDNAIRHTPAGGKVDVILRRADSRITLSVVDSGPGIPERDLERVLDRFYRGEDAQGQGSGLGLAIVARIAQRHQVTLTLRNDSDRGGLSASVSGL